MNDQSGTPAIHGSIFNFLAALLRKHGVQAVLVGGYALNASKVQRMTFDVDFAVTAEARARLEPDILAAGYSVFNRQQAFVQYRGEGHGLRDLDLLLCDRHTVNSLLATGRRIRIAGDTFVIPSVTHLIAMKLHSITTNPHRELKDFPDVVQLIQLNDLDPRDTHVKELFERYGATELYARLLTLTGAHDG